MNIELKEITVRELTQGYQDTEETAPEMIVAGNPIPKTGYTPPTPPFKPW